MQAADYVVTSNHTGTLFTVSDGTCAPMFAGSDLATVLGQLFAYMLAAQQNTGGASPNTVCNRHIVFEARGAFSSGWLLTSRLDFPPMQNCVLDARTVTFVGQGIRFDSTMDCSLLLGVVAGQTNGIALDIAPRTVGPDGLTIFTDSTLEVSSVAGYATPPAGSVGLRLSAAAGEIIRGHFRARNIHGFERLVYVPNPAVGQAVLECEIVADVYNPGTTGVRLGDASATGISGHRVTLAGDGLPTLCEQWGAQSIVTVQYQGSCAQGVILQPGAQRNLVMGPVALQDNSGNTTNKSLVC